MDDYDRVGYRSIGDCPFVIIRRAYMLVKPGENFPMRDLTEAVAFVTMMLFMVGGMLILLQEMGWIN